ncbi:hypothetical protein GLOTRDRAFT_76869 [Gloeophyllum trabeum ATCC 11539]|uniref:Uncharacterized protein n=1 Tax=Gloeophyllum trabeum (strain ATCC 11539 / FP-39264 / Madison 617) TaxID=670483 RepID=S7RJ70_GLOTA|nr:uncharacterized protein GLOTRDRAFT_76869 [Gloeophyllum trabeum ATCC 11539]EPQ54395.1 hypothetical protein GLOTRDRAFT_76869 [Gloeophyllum trabeum ATCC 11539]
MFDSTDLIGPAGLMAALTLSRMGIKPLVIDAADHASHEYGRSDAFQCRCMEVMQSFGAPIEQLEHMGKKLYGRTFWEVSPTKQRRTAFARFYPEFLDFDKDYSLAVRQGLIEQVMIHDIENHFENFRVQWGWGFVSMELAKEQGAHSEVTIRNTQTGEEKKVWAKYVIGCDGARSSVRKWANQFGVRLEGEALPVTWCVLDAVGLKSDHPDLERLCIVRSTKGIVLVIPREPINGKPAARFDIQLEKSRYEAKEEDATRMIKDIFAPYKVEWEEVNWWSSYDVGQRIINSYTVDEKVFFVGDACHTHSPRAGLGLNTALLESHNLGWKLALVLRGAAKPEVLSTYASERHKVAQELVRMDRRLVELYAGLEKQTMNDFSGDEAADWLHRLRLYQAANYAYQAGASIVYDPSLITTTQSGETDSMTIGKPGVAVGSRTRPAVVHRLSDSVPVPVLSPFDGRFTVYILAGDLSQPGALDRLKEIDAYIRSSQGSVFAKYGSDIDVHAKEVRKRMPKLQVPTAHESKSAGAEAFPPGRVLYHYDYDDDKKHSRIFDPAHFFTDDIPVVNPYRETAPEAGLVFEHPMHKKWGVDEKSGAIIVARPDAHVALKTEGFGKDAWAQVEKYFDAFLL